MTSTRMKFGIFMAPFHPLGENPTLAIDRDLELIRWLDDLGYDEAWVGEHHSAGWETIASPEVFIATAAQQTRHIKLGTGVVSLPYHHPLMVADRMVLLDHLTRGRVMFGVGPGALVSDAMMMGISPPTQRPRMEEAMGVIMRLFTEVEPFSHEAEWFTLRNARLQVRPYTQPHMPIAVAAVSSPAGMVTAGKFGAGVLTFSLPRGENARPLKEFWGIAEQTAAEHGNVMDRSEWRIVIPTHLAESKQEAMDQIRAGAYRYHREYRNATLNLETDIEVSPETLPETMAEQGDWCVGTPEDLVAWIERVQEMSGGFGGVMVQVVDWASREHMMHSFELIARNVMPRFQQSLPGLVASQADTARQVLALDAERKASMAQAQADYEARNR